MEKGVSAEFPGIQLNPPHLDRGLCVSLAINRERGKYQQTKKQRKNGEISAKVPEDLPKYRSLRHKTNHTLNFGSIRMGTCIQKYGCKQLVSAVDALMPKMGIYEKFDVLTVIANLRILENEFIFLVMLIIYINGPIMDFFLFTERKLLSDKLDSRSFTFFRSHTEVKAIVVVLRFTNGVRTT